MPPTVDTSEFQYAMWDLHSTMAAAASSPGLVTGGRPNVRYKTIRHKGIAMQQSFRPGLNIFQPNVKVKATKDSKALFQAGLRGGNPGLTLLQMQGGTTQQGWAFDNMVLNTLKCSFGNTESAIEADLGFFALNAVKQTGATAQTALGGNVLMGFDAAIQIGSSDYGVEKAEWEFTNNCSTGTTGDAGRTSGTIRNPNWLVVGHEDHKLTIDTLMPLSTTPLTDYPAQNIGLVMVITDDAAHVQTWTYSGLTVDEGAYDQEFVDEGTVKFKHVLIGKPGCLVVT